MDIWAELRERVEVIRHHWWTFVLSVALGAVLAFIAASTLYDARIETVEAMNAFLRDRLESGLPVKESIPATGASLPWIAIGLWSLIGVVALAAASLGWASVRAVRTRRKTTKPGPDVSAPTPKAAPPALAKPATHPARLEPEKAAPTPSPPSSPSDGGSFLKPNLKPARPEVDVRSITRDSTAGPMTGGQVRALLRIANVTATGLTKCSILVHSIESEGSHTPVGAYILRGKDRTQQFPIAAKSEINAILGFRNFEVAPYQDFQINAARSGMNALAPHEPILLGDNMTHRVNIIADSGAGVITRAVFEVVVGEYEELQVKLLGQSSWHQSR